MIKNEIYMNPSTIEILRFETILRRNPFTGRDEMFGVGVLGNDLVPPGMVWPTNDSSSRAMFNSLCHSPLCCGKPARKEVGDGNS
jgi:hypothetical protein